MKLSGLLQRTRPELPGVAGIARVDRRTDALLRRVKAGEIAVLDQVDLDRATADALVAAGVVGCRQRLAVDLRTLPEPRARRSSSTPGIALVDDVGSGALHTIKDGSRIRLHEGVVYAGEFELAAASRRTSSPSPTRWSRPRRASPTSSRRSPPTPPSSCAGAGAAARRRRHPGRRRRAGRPAGGRRRRRVRPRRRAGAAQGLHPRVPAGAGRRRGRRRRAAGGRATRPRPHRRRPGRDLERGADLRGGHRRARRSTTGTRPACTACRTSAPSAVTFPSSANPEDLALLLAAHHGAAMIVTVGLSATHGRVPRPRPLGQQRLDVPHPAAGRRRCRGRAGDRRAVPQPVSIGAILLLIGAVAGRGGGRAARVRRRATRCSPGSTQAGTVSSATIKGWFG